MVDLRSSNSRAARSSARQQPTVHNLVHLPSPGDTIPNSEDQTESMVRRIKMETQTQSVIDDTATQRLRSTTAMPEFQPIDTVGKGVKELVQAINKIEALGINKVAGATPKIVVIGDQSAGKSSVINAISGIQVPRSTGTCTRCPMQITLTANQEPNARWRCEVSLRHEFFHNPERSSFFSEEKLPPFHPWRESDQPNTTLFKTVYDKNELQNVIHHAQLAVLNPKSNPIDFVPNQSTSQFGPEQYEVEFSPNLVCLDISAPDLPNLSFYDLPGVITQTENGENPYLIKLVKQLVKRYIAKDNALVLLACSMESDIQNSNAAYLLRKHGSIDRCMGILTKPDRLPRGDPVDQWERILRGESLVLGHGYHVVKNPSQLELDKGMTDPTSARRLEQDFFRLTKLWADRFSVFKDRFGTETLQEKLSQMLAVQILKSLPHIHDRVQKQLARIDNELEHLPEPPTVDALRIVLDAITAFVSKVARQMEGNHPDNQFRLIWKALRTQFREGITLQRPTLKVRTASDVTAARSMRAGSQMPPSQSASRPSQFINLDSDDERQASPTPAKKRKMAPNSTPSQRSAVGDEFTKRFGLDEIRKTLDDLSSSDIPGEIDPKAVNFLRLQTLQHWDQPMNQFLKGVETALKGMLNQALDDALRAWKTTELCAETGKIAHSFLNVAFHEQREMVGPRALRLERHKPMTENAATLEYNEKKELEIFQNARVSARANVYFDELEKSTGKHTSTAERQKKTNDIGFRNQLGPDPYAREVEAMSKIRGYYNIASMRFIDHVCQSLQVELFEKLRTELRDELTTALDVYGENGQDTCVRLLAEDPARENRRRTLKADKEKLVAALECLQQLDEKYQQGRAAASTSSTLSDGIPVNDSMNGFTEATAGPSSQGLFVDAMDTDDEA